VELVAALVVAMHRQQQQQQEEVMGVISSRRCPQGLVAVSLAGSR
jgi:hypothetical protein